MTTECARRPFWDNDAAARGDNPYFPEFVSPSNPSGWRAIVEPGRWYVYVLYSDDVQRHPVYVGMTNDVSRRLAQHRKGKAWWPLVHRIIVDRCDTKAEAREREKLLIHQTQPLFNVVSNLHTVEVN